jgi:gliding motility-associated-like protein/uncharacterized repeat protein (TIGR01451 family)
VSVVATTQAGEPNFNGLFTVSITNALSVDTTVGYTVSGTATADADYTALTGSVVIPAGATSATLSVDVIDDTIVETGGETVIVTLSITDSAVTIASEDTATVTIADNDASEVSIGIVATNQASEPDNDGLFTFALSNIVSVDTEVNFTITGTATEGVDYEVIGTSVIIPANSLSVTIPVVVIDDSIVELTEAVVISVTGTDSAVTVSTTNIATVTIADNDTSEVSIIATTQASEPSTNGLFTLSLNNVVSVDTEVSYSISGTATNGVDYTTLTGIVTIPENTSSITIPVEVIDDNFVEAGGETVIVTLLSTNSGAGIATQDTATITISDDDASEVSIATTTDAGEPNFNGIFTVTLNNSVSVDTQVDYTVSGTATEGTDYVTLTGSVIIPANTNSAVIDVAVIDDTIVEGDETVIVTLTGTDSSVTVSSTNEATITITDNDASILSISATIQASEPNIDGEFTLTLTEPISIDTEVTFTVSGTAIEDVDYTSLGTTIIIPANTTSITIPVVVIDDLIVEPSGESVTVTIVSADSPIVIGSPDDATVTIADNDIAAPSIELIKDASLSGEGVVGDIITYTFTINNTGNVPLVDIEIEDDMLSSKPIVVSGIIEPGESTTISADYMINQADIDSGSVVNSAIVSAVDMLFDTIVADISDNGNVNDGDDNPTVLALAQSMNIAIVKTGTFNDVNGDGYAQAGETISYSFTVTNTGNVTLTNITISDPLLGVELTGGPISLDAGESDSTSFTATYTLTQDDVNLGSVSNQAIVFGTAPDGTDVQDLSDDTSTAGDNTTITTLSGCVIEVFNAVSPNNDGDNDVFLVRGLECYPKNRVEIYNRWGVLVFERDQYNNSDRAFRGISEGRVTVNKSEELPEGTYYYVLKYEDFNGTNHEKAGYLYINRK